MCMLSMLSMPVMADNMDVMYDWQRNQLFSPDDDQKVRERDGFVFIYSGLRDVDVMAAMDAEYERIEYMMFVNTVHTDGEGKPLRDAKTGEVITDDDGC